MSQTATAQVTRPNVIEQLSQLDQAVFDAFPIGIYFCGCEGRILRVNRRTEERVRSNCSFGRPACNAAWPSRLRWAPG